jgi:hypothetical protein
MDGYDHEFSFAEIKRICSSPAAFYRFIMDGLELLKELQRMISE